MTLLYSEMWKRVSEKVKKSCSESGYGNTFSNMSTINTPKVKLETASRANEHGSGDDGDGGC